MSAAATADTSTLANAAAATAVVAVVDPELRRSLVEALGKTAMRVVDDTYNSGDLNELAALIERLRPSILFLGLPGLSEDAPAAVARMAGLAFAPRVVAVNSAASPEIILKTMRAGASEFVYAPFEADFEAALRSVIDGTRIQPEAAVTGRVIGFSSAKGGCGATTLACHAAAWLKTIGKKEVLLADLDVSAGIAAALMQSNGRYTLGDALQNLHRLDLRLWKALVSTSPSGVDILPSPPDPSALIPISRKLPSMVRFWRMQYDWAILDLGRGLAAPLLDVLGSIDAVVLVTTNEIPALRQAKQMIEYLAGRDFGANRLRLVLNRMPKRAAVGTAELEKILGLPVFSVIPDDYSALSEAYSRPQLIDLDSDLGGQFSNFAAKLAGIARPPKRSRGFFTFRNKKHGDK